MPKLDKSLPKDATRKPRVRALSSAHVIPRPRGRPSAYKPEYLATAAAVTAMGGTLYEAAHAIGTSHAQLLRWMEAHDDLRQALTVAEETASQRVELKLYELAMGFEYDAEEIQVVDGRIYRVQVRKRVLPSPAAVIFWLKNRMPHKWRDGFQFNFELPRPEEIEQRMRELEDEL